jgi:hypothetical protein
MPTTTTESEGSSSGLRAASAANMYALAVGCVVLRVSFPVRCTAGDFAKSRTTALPLTGSIASWRTSLDRDVTIADLKVWDSCMCLSSACSTLQSFLSVNCRSCCHCRCRCRCSCRRCCRCHRRCSDRACRTCEGDDKGYCAL